MSEFVTTSKSRTVTAHGIFNSNVKGSKFNTKKSIESKKQIQKLSRNFQGSNTDREVIAILGISKNSYYKYKKELLEEKAR